MNIKILNLLLICLLAYSCNKHDDSSDEGQNNGCMVFERTTIEYGTIQKGADGRRIFNFKNEENEPLVIKSAKSSCGCLVPTYPTDPIMPGESGTIEVNYDTQRVGVFTKTVTVVTNCADDDTITLTVKGDVRE
jgi:Protein of unknown function (DUF1573)